MFRKLKAVFIAKRTNYLKFLVAQFSKGSPKDFD
jgi:hypothetical protein